MVEGYSLWLVIWYCLGHPKTLILESLVESFITLQFFGVFYVQTLQNCGFVMCFCFVSFQLSSHIKVQSHSALSYILLVLFSFT